MVAISVRTELNALKHSFCGRLLLLTTAPRSQHQCRGCDPEEENEDFGGEAGYGVGGAAAREGIRTVVCESRGVSEDSTFICRRVGTVHCMDRYGECGDRSYYTDCESTIDAVPPRAMRAIVADQHEKEYAENQLCERPK